MTANKSLGQHWLKDRTTLAQIADYADLNKNDTVLEIGPGQGTLTSELLRRAGKVVAVEFDPELARKLPGQFPGKNLEVINQDILALDLAKLPAGYKVVANIPYYITSKVIQKLLTAVNKPTRTVLLVQKEVAERLAALPGKMSLLAVSAQAFARVELGIVVPAALFTPPPKVNSRVVILTTYTNSMFDGLSEADFFRIVKAGFSAKRKKLRTSLAGGLNIDRQTAEDLLIKAKIDPNVRAEALDLADWQRLAVIAKQ